MVEAVEEDRREAEKTPEERRVEKEEKVKEEERVKEEQRVKKEEDVEMGVVERERAKTPPLREKEPGTPKRPRGEDEEMVDAEREVKKLKNSD
mgnify:FL=1